MTPRISVIMAAHNAARHLREAVDSILTQTLTEFELIVVDDASTDNTAAILAEIATTDPRVIVLRNPSNLGPYPSANRGLDAARAPIIARMDADDISAPTRLAWQLEFLDAHPEHMLVATSYRSIDDAGRVQFTKRKGAPDAAVRWLLRFRMCMEHPSLCFRAKWPDGTPVRYDEAHAVAQDYDLVTKLAARGKVAILPDVLFSYRTHASNITSTRKVEQKRNVLRIATSVQNAVLAPDLVAGFEAMMRSYVLSEKASANAVRDAVATFDQMLSGDLVAHPGAAPWLRRQAAEILAHAFLRNGGGQRDPAVLWAFVVTGRRYLVPLVLRVLENRGSLPFQLAEFPAKDAVSPPRG